MHARARPHAGQSTLSMGHRGLQRPRNQTQPPLTDVGVAEGGHERALLAQRVEDGAGEGEGGALLRGAAAAGLALPLALALTRLNDAEDFECDKTFSPLAQEDLYMRNGSGDRGGVRGWHELR